MATPRFGQGVLLAATAALLLGGCEVPTEKRCPSGYDYETDWKFCLKAPAGGAGGAAAQDGGAGGAPSAAGAAGAAGAGGATAPGGAATVAGAGGVPDEPSGPALGDACGEAADCSGAVDFCLLNPLAPDDPGICTISDCAPGDCDDGYHCCDCGSVAVIPWPAPICFPDGQQSTVIALGCTCA